MKIGRIVCAGRAPKTTEQARKVLLEGLFKLPHERIIITPGGFSRLKLESSLPFPRGWGTGWPAFRMLSERAIWFVRRNVFRGGEHLTAHKTVTVCVDVYDPRGKVAELVVVRQDYGEVTWHVTGKSFPRTDEEKELYLAPPHTHIVMVQGWKVLVLGCHDLNAWSRRSIANAKTRARTDKRRELVNWVDTIQPSIVLHHPHATDSHKTWLPGWSGIKKSLNIRHHASAIGYYNEYGRFVEGFREPLDKVLATYRSENVKDIVFTGFE